MRHNMRSGGAPTDVSRTLSESLGTTNEPTSAPVGPSSRSCDLSGGDCHPLEMLRSEQQTRGRGRGRAHSCPRSSRQQELHMHRLPPQPSLLTPERLQLLVQQFLEVTARTEAPLAEFIEIYPYLPQNQTYGVGVPPLPSKDELMRLFECNPKFALTKEETLVPVESMAHHTAASGVEDPCPLEPTASSSADVKPAVDEHAVIPSKNGAVLNGKSPEKAVQITSADTYTTETAGDGTTDVAGCSERQLSIHVESGPPVALCPLSDPISTSTNYAVVPSSSPLSATRSGCCDVLRNQGSQDRRLQSRQGSCFPACATPASASFSVPSSTAGYRPGWPPADPYPRHWAPPPVQPVQPSSPHTTFSVHSGTPHNVDGAMSAGGYHAHWHLPPRLQGYAEAFQSASSAPYPPQRGVTLASLGYPCSPSSCASGGGSSSGLTDPAIVRLGHLQQGATEPSQSEVSGDLVDSVARLLGSVGEDAVSVEAALAYAENALRERFPRALKDPDVFENFLRSNGRVFRTFRPKYSPSSMVALRGRMGGSGEAFPQSSSSSSSSSSSGGRVRMEPFLPRNTAGAKT
eukprot:RCo032915